MHIPSFPDEPALYVGVATAIIGLAVAFGVPITPDEKVAMIGVIAPTVALAGAVVVRQNSVPVPAHEAAVAAALATTTPPVAS